MCWQPWSAFNKSYASKTKERTYRFAQVLENGHRVAMEGAERVLAALEGKYIQSYPYVGYDVAHRH